MTARRDSRKLLRPGRRHVRARLVTKRLNQDVAWPPYAMGYARVSTNEQDLGMQIAALKAAGVPPDRYRLFQEKVSSTDLRRPQWHLLVKMLCPGDTLYVYAFNRISRDLAKLLAFIDWAKERGIRIRSTSEPHIDPHTTNGRLLVSVTGAVDENERRRIRDRTVDGMAERKRQGQAMGRPVLVTPKVAAQMRKLRYRKTNPVPVPRIAKQFKVSASAVYNATARKKR